MSTSRIIFNKANVGGFLRTNFEFMDPVAQKIQALSDPLLQDLSSSSGKNLQRTSINVTKPPEQYNMRMGWCIDKSGAITGIFIAKTTKHKFLVCKISKKNCEMLTVFSRFTCVTNNNIEYLTQEDGLLDQCKKTEIQASVIFSSIVEDELYHPINIKEFCQDQMDMLPDSIRKIVYPSVIASHIAPACITTSCTSHNILSAPNRNPTENTNQYALLRAVAIITILSNPNRDPAESLNEETISTTMSAIMLLGSSFLQQTRFGYN